MRRIMAVATLALTAVLLSCSAPEDQVDAVPTDAPGGLSGIGIPFELHTDRVARVLFTGDSLTGGYFAPTQAEAFPSLVSRWIGPSERTEASRAGQKLTTVASITEVPPNLDLAVVELGTNDVSEQTPLVDFRLQYDNLLRRIRDTSSGAAVVCAGAWADIDSVRPYDEIIRGVCESYDGVFVELSSIYSDKANRGPAGVSTPFGESDTFHPNGTGHEKIAKAIASAIGVEQTSG